MGESPTHIGIILDGNRRWAKRHLLEPTKGHAAGAKLLEDLFQWAIDLKIKELTLYTLSIQNLTRDKAEVSFLFTLLHDEIGRLLKDERIEKEQVRIRFTGRTHLLPEHLQERIREVETKTAAYDRVAVNFAVCYGGREEIVDAVKKLVKDGVEVTEESISERLWVTGEPDLVIRTGGDRRTSNFLVWQSIYSEWVFLEKTWPEFTKEDLENAIADFKGRERRFGK